MKVLWLEKLPRTVGQAWLPRLIYDISPSPAFPPGFLPLSTYIILCRHGKDKCFYFWQSHLSDFSVLFLKGFHSSFHNISQWGKDTLPTRWGTPNSFSQECSTTKPIKM